MNKHQLLQDPYRRLRRILSNLLVGPVTDQLRINRKTDLAGRFTQFFAVLAVLMFFFLSFVFLFEGGKIPSDGVTNKTEVYREPKQQTIITLVLASFGMLFSLGCLAVNILYRKHRLVFGFYCLASV